MGEPEERAEIALAERYLPKAPSEDDVRLLVQAATTSTTPMRWTRLGVEQLHVVSTYVAS